MSAASETYVSIGQTCVEHIEETFKYKAGNVNRHRNQIVDLTKRVERLCNKIGKKQVSLSSGKTVQNLIELNKELYRVIFAEEPPSIDGHDLHVAITLLEKICVLMTENDFMTMFRQTPVLRKT